MECLFRLPGYTLVIGFRRRKTRAGTVTAEFNPELSEYESLGIRSGPGSNCPFPGGQRNRVEEKEAIELFELAQIAISELRPGISHAGGKKLEKGQLLFSLRLLLRKYPALFAVRALPFQVAINHCIIGEVAKHCCFHLNEQELQYCWALDE